eukprot:CAMPEP_0117507798 /NCGR_PEP_ID=MMETSP0784-20121206/26612_1 /TAXON_ID=39447 /ORGANISM="" /LENGTH=640 /DNA_ID=CAMNT_0005303319 /DNA_START=20 /DNA_END=1939 /DNA_ORIENTATION=-
MYGENLRTIPPGVDGAACLESVRQRVNGPEGPAPGSAEDSQRYLRSDHMLVRFLVARQWDVDKATAMLSEHYRWLGEKRMDALMQDPFPEEVHIKKYYPQSFHGTDKKGRPLYIERPGLIDMPRLCQYVKPDRLVDYFVVGSEAQVRRRLPACSLARGEVVDKSLNIVDLEGLGLGLVSHHTARRVLKEIAKANQNHYPEMMGKLIIVNAPRVFSLAWSFVKPLLDAKTVAKISIYGTDKAAIAHALLDLVDADQLPQLFGGNCKCDGSDPTSCMHHVKGPWVDPEIVAILDSQPLEYLMSPDGAKLLVQQRANSSSASTLTVPAEAGGEPTQGASDGSDVDGDDTFEPLPAKLSEMPPGLAVKVEQAQQEVQDLAAEYQRLEGAHIRTLELWVEERNMHVVNVGRHALERAQAYYDKMSIWNQVVQEYARQQDEVEAMVMACDKAVKNLSKAEHAFEAFCSGVGSDLTDEEWEELAGPSEDCHEVPDHPKLIRAYRLCVLGDRVATLQRQRDSVLAEAKAKTHELDEARKRFENEQLKHRECGSGCSVKRAAPYYERCRMQDRVIEEERLRLHQLEQKLHAARHRVVELQVGIGRQSDSPSCLSAISSQYKRVAKYDEMSLQSFELPGAQPSEDSFHSV